MSLALVLTLGLASAGPAPVAPQQADVAQLVRDACMGTDLRREAFEALGRDRRWRRTRTTSRDSAPGSWSVAYRIGEAAVVLSRIPTFGSGDASQGSVCMVTVDQAAPALKDEIASLASSLNLAAGAPIVDLASGIAPVQIWSGEGDWTLTYSAAADGRAAASLSRQIVIDDPAPVSPPGN